MQDLIVGNVSLGGLYFLVVSTLLVIQTKLIINCKITGLCLGRCFGISDAGAILLCVNEKFKSYKYPGTLSLGVCNDCSS